jgi:uncharacterized protein YceK
VWAIIELSGQQGGIRLKKLILCFITTALLSGCSATSSQASINSEVVENEEATILYTGTVIDSGETHENGLFVADLVPVESSEAASFDEVILLMEGVPLIDLSSGENVPLSALEKGDSVTVTLVEHAPTTMSIPPQIPGMGIVKVEK